MRLGVSEAKVDGEIIAGDVVVDGGLVAEVGASPPGRAGLAAPGFIDLQVNGFAGVDFLAAGADGYAAAGASLARTGVTASQPTFISSPLSAYEAALEVVRSVQPCPGGPRVLGIHLEGPFINPTWAGAHDPLNAREPDLELATSLCDAGPVTYMTLAPELPGALGLIDQLVERGIVVACGHSGADAPTAHSAFDHGARAVTHIYNAQRRWQPRDPGISGAAIVRSEVTVQAILDFVHLAPEAAFAAFLAARGRFAIVTDAIMAAGLSDGTYSLGDRQVFVSEGAARLTDGTLAGSISTMDTALRNLVSLGAELSDALDAASFVPARLIGRPELGTLHPATPADVIVLDDSLAVARTLVDGREVFAA
jgi:N-acetylglucosamine-6-phosphate deacetylase